MGNPQKYERFQRQVKQNVGRGVGVWGYKGEEGHS